MTAARWFVVLCWCVLGFVFTMQWMRAKRGRAETGRRVDRLSMVGLAFEIASIALPPVFRVPDPGWPATVYIAASTLGVVATVFGLLAGAELGRNLRVQAVVTDDHRLVTTGPYAVVRHPIYAMLLGLAVATAVAWSRWPVTLAAVALMVIGIELRVRSEERLLASHFGAEYERYRERVRAYVPFVR